MDLLTLPTINSAVPTQFASATSERMFIDYMRMRAMNGSFVPPAEGMSAQARLTEMLNARLVPGALETTFFEGTVRITDRTEMEESTGLNEHDEPDLTIGWASDSALAYGETDLAQALIAMENRVPGLGQTMMAHLNGVVDELPTESVRTPISLLREYDAQNWEGIYADSLAKGLTLKQIDKACKKRIKMLWRELPEDINERLPSSIIESLVAPGLTEEIVLRPKVLLDITVEILMQAGYAEAEASAAVDLLTKDIPAALADLQRFNNIRGVIRGWSCHALVLWAGRDWGGSSLCAMLDDIVNDAYNHCLDMTDFSISPKSYCDLSNGQYSPPIRGSSVDEIDLLAAFINLMKRIDQLVGLIKRAEAFAH